jgi:L-threonylcarbamoyladenylate synthase
MALSIPLQRAGRIIRSGGVVAYPTEGIYGLGCLPICDDAVRRILLIKQRDPALGLILIAADARQLSAWLADDVRIDELHSSAEKPVTWIVPASTDVPWLVCGNNEGIAVRITQHPVAAALCRASDSALVSTSANVSGHAPARNAYVLRRAFGRLVDCIVAGPCGTARGPSEIRNWQSGKIVRPAGT